MASIVTGDARVRVVSELREEIDVESIAAILVDAALLISEGDPEPTKPACRTDDDDRKADSS